MKTDFRMTKRTTEVGGVEVTAGTPLMLLNGAANRDPRRFECPARVPDRPAQRRGPRGLRAGRPLLPRRPAGPLRGPGQPRAHPRPHAEHPPVRGAPRPARRPALRLRADVDPARPHRACTSSSTRRVRLMGRVAVVTGAASGIGLGHRPAARRRRARRRPARPQRPGRRGGAPPSCGTGGTKAMGLEVDVADRDSVDAAVAEARGDARGRSASSSPAPASSRSRRSPTSPRRAGTASSR